MAFKGLERRTAMQVDGAAHGVGTIPRPKRLKVLVAIVAVVVIAALVALLVWTAPLATSGVEAQDTNAGAGSAVLHDDAGNMITEVVGAGSAVVHDDAGNMLLGAGSAVVHDDAGNVKR
jgi:hypothetical protein